MRSRAKRHSRRTHTVHHAVAVLQQQVTGVVRFVSTGDALTVRYDIRKLSDGLHGLHVHECGDMTRGCESACAHFSPRGTEYGGAHSRVRHAGDLGNIASSGGRATLTRWVEMFAFGRVRDLNMHCGVTKVLSTSTVI